MNKKQTFAVFCLGIVAGHAGIKVGWHLFYLSVIVILLGMHLYQ